MLKITEKFEKELEELRQKPLRARIRYAFDTLWYDSAIPDAGTRALRTACELIFPNNDDDDNTLQGKGLLIVGLGGDIFCSENETSDIAKLKIEACVLPDMNRRTVKYLIEQQSTKD